MLLETILGKLFDSGTMLLFLGMVVVYLLYRHTFLPPGFPPGPQPWPFVGNTPQLAKAKFPHKLLTSYRGKYGDIVGIKYGWYPAIVLNTLQSIKLALVDKSDIFTSRPNPEWFYMISVNDMQEGIAFQSGQRWKSARHFIVSSLRQFGVGQHAIEEKIILEVNIVCEILNDNSESPMDPTIPIQNAICNIILSLCFGSRFEYTGPEFKEITRRISYHMEKFSSTKAVNVLPILRYSPTEKWFWDYVDNYKQLSNLIGRQIERHRDTFDIEQIRDIIDRYLEKESELGVDSEKDAFSTKVLKNIIIDLLVAGTETTSITILWIILYMINFPDVQTKCQKEMDNVLGLHCKPLLADRIKLPFIDSTIHEVQRVTSLVPLALPHVAQRSTTLMGYKIPAGTMVYPNIYAVHHDNSLWVNPEEFQPERWLNSEGMFQKNDAFLVYGIGPRKCPGEVMARDELFIFVTTMLQKFTFHATDPLVPPSLEPRNGIVLSPAPFKVIIKTR